MSVQAQVQASWTRFLELLRIVFLTNPEDRPFPTLYLVGDTGIGKNTMVQNLSTTLDIPSSIVNLSGAEPADIQGFLIRDGEKHRWTLPYFFTDADSGWKTRGKVDPLIAKILGEIPKEKLPVRIIFLDEFGRVQRDVHNPLMNVILSHELHGRRLEPRVLVIAAGNQKSNDQQDFHVQAIDDAQRARLRVIEILPQVDEWVAHAKLEGVHPVVIQFLKNDPEIVRVWNSKHVGIDLRTLTELGVRLARMDEAIFKERGQLFCSLFLPLELSVALTKEILSSYESGKPEVVLFEYPKVRSRIQDLVSNNQLAELHALVEKVPELLRGIDESPEDSDLVQMQKAEKKKKAYEHLLLLHRDIPRELFAGILEQCVDLVADSDVILDLFDFLAQDAEVMKLADVPANAGEAA